MKVLQAEQLYFLHNAMTGFMVAMCFLIVFLSFKIKNQKHKMYVSYLLISFSILQECLDYANRLLFDQLYDFKISTDLPLQFCTIGFYFSVFGIYMAVSNKKFNAKLEQFIFDCAYVLGFSGALQALFAVDLTGVNNIIGVFTLNWTHTLIIINVLWLIFSYKKRFALQGIFNTFIFIKLIIWPVGLINYVIDANYMFICQPPNIESSFFIGGWPKYLFWLEFIYFIYILMLYLPFRIYALLKH